MADVTRRDPFLGVMWTPTSRYQLFATFGATSPCLGDSRTLACAVDTWVACHNTRWPTPCAAIAHPPFPGRSLYFDWQWRDPDPVVAYEILEQMTVNDGRRVVLPAKFVREPFLPVQLPQTGDVEVALKICGLSEWPGLGHICQHLDFVSVAFFRVGDRWHFRRKLDLVFSWEHTCPPEATVPKDCRDAGGGSFTGTMRRLDELGEDRRWLLGSRPVRLSEAARSLLRPIDERLKPAQEAGPR